MTAPNPIPVFDGSPTIIQADSLSQRIHDGAKAGRTAVARALLNQEIKQVERMLPPVPPRMTAARNRAALSERERYMISPHPQRATGARNSTDDLRLLQVAHDELSKLGAVCRKGSQNDGNRNP
jgi:hypothetical protein